MITGNVGLPLMDSQRAVSYTHLLRRHKLSLGLAALGSIICNPRLIKPLSGISGVNDGFHCHALLSVKRWAVLPPHGWGVPLVTYHQKSPGGQGPMKSAKFSLDSRGISDMLHGDGTPISFPKCYHIPTGESMSWKKFRTSHKIPENSKNNWRIYGAVFSARFQLAQRFCNILAVY